MMFAVSLRQADRIRSYSVSHDGGGWEIKTEEDRRLTNHRWCRDWHRVERVLDQFRREVADLIAQGWELQSTNR
jgi:hypothetical protein